MDKAEAGKAAGSRDEAGALAPGFARDLADIRERIAALTLRVAGANDARLRDEIRDLGQAVVRLHRTGARLADEDAGGRGWPDAAP